MCVIVFIDLEEIVIIVWEYGVEVFFLCLAELVVDNSIDMEFFIYVL